MWLIGANQNYGFRPKRANGNNYDKKWNNYFWEKVGILSYGLKATRLATMPIHS